MESIMSTSRMLRPFLVASVLACGGLLVGCRSSELVWHENGTPEFRYGEKSWYQFTYHPEQDVYFEPYSNTYFWKDNGGQWASSHDLPWGIELDHSSATIVKLRDYHPLVEYMVAERLTYDGIEHIGSYASVPVTE